MSAATATVIPFPTPESQWSDEEWIAEIKRKVSTQNTAKEQRIKATENEVYAMLETAKMLAAYRKHSHKRGDRSNTFQASCETNLKGVMVYSTANKYADIGDYTRFYSQSSHIVSKIPLSWGTVWELTRLTESQFDEAIKSGAIHPEMTRADAEALRGKVKAETVTKPNTPTVTATTPAGVSASVTQAEKDVAAEEAERVYQATLVTDEDKEMLRKKANPTLPIIAQIGTLMDLKITNNNHFFTDRFLEDINKDYFLSKAKGVFLNEISSGKSLDSAITSAKKAIRIAEIDSLERIKQALFKVSNDAMLDFLRHAKSDPLLDITNARTQKLLTRALDKSSSDTERLAALNALQKMKT